jgi:uncharacterized repeat protein (TIGR02543 family)
MRKLKQVLRSPFSVLRTPYSVLRSSPELRFFSALIILALALSGCDTGSTGAHLGPWTVTFETGEGSNVPYETVQNGQAIAAMPSDPTRNLHTFTGWFTDIALTTPFNHTTPITVSITLYARWHHHSYRTDGIILAPIAGGYAVTGFTGTATEVIIPGIYNGEPVTSIGNSSFFDKQRTSIFIPSSITSIEPQAFMRNLLTSVSIPSSVTTIGDHAFATNRLASVTIPSNVTTIGDGAFSGNHALTEINVSSGNQNFSSENGVLFNRDGTSLLAWPAGKPGVVTIPPNVTTIRGWVFSSFQLTSVTIPSSVISIGELAFAGNQLESISIPSSVISIGAWAFGFNPLTSVTIPFASVADADAAWGTAWRNQMPAAFNNVDYEGWVFEPPSP